MSRYIGPKNRISRRFGINLFGRPKDPLAKKRTAPGKAPGFRSRQKSDYRKHLEEKQKVRLYYGGIREKQFRQTFQRAVAKEGETMTNFLGMLESRLDVVVFRMNFCPTIFGARQMVNHGHFNVNGQKVNIASYQVKPGDEISLREKSRKSAMFLSWVQNPERSLPAYVSMDAESFSGKFEKFPEKSEIPFPFTFDEGQIVEYYSK